MTPDKIFISIERTYGASNGREIAMATPHSERQSVNDIEYIRKDALISLIESRIGEILGDAQPAPVLRIELRELINKIKE